MSEDARLAPRPPFFALRARLAGRTADASLHEDAPSHLDEALRQWLVDAEDIDLDDQPSLDVRVRLRLGITPGSRGGGHGGLSALLHVDMIEVVDATLGQLEPHVTLYGDLLQYPQGSNGDHARKLLQRLDHILELGCSAYRVAATGRQLEPRVAPTVTAHV